MTAATSRPILKTLSGVQRGNTAVVSHFGDQTLAGRLISMGVLPGSLVMVMRSAPFGGGMYVKADNLLLALRSEEAGTIIIR